MRWLAPREVLSPQAHHQEGAFIHGNRPAFAILGLARSHPNAPAAEVNRFDRQVTAEDRGILESTDCDVPLDQAGLESNMPSDRPGLVMRRKLRELLENYEVLRRVVEYRDGLQALWNETAANPTRALVQLRDWCSRAEGSGIGALREFAQGLRAYARASSHVAA